MACLISTVSHSVPRGPLRPCSGGSKSMQRVVTDRVKSHSLRAAGTSPLAWALAGVALLGGCQLYDFGDLLHGSHGSGSGGAAGGGSGVCEFDGGQFLS